MDGCATAFSCIASDHDRSRGFVQAVWRKGHCRRALIRGAAQVLSPAISARTGPASRQRCACCSAWIAPQPARRASTDAAMTGGPLRCAIGLPRAPPGADWPTVWQSMMTRPRNDARRQSRRWSSAAMRRSSAGRRSSQRSEFAGQPRRQTFHGRAERSRRDERDDELVDRSFPPGAGSRPMVPTGEVLVTG